MGALAELRYSVARSAYPFENLSSEVAEFVSNPSSTTRPGVIGLGIVEVQQRMKPSGNPAYLNRDEGRSTKSGYRRGILCSIHAAILMMVGSPLVGCYPIGTKSDVVGLYELHVGQNQISLEVSPDETFTETIRWESGKVEKRTGQWHWKNGAMSFNKLWIPPAFAPDYILSADAQSGPNQPKYTEPIVWGVTPESHWGTITLSVYPDSDINFRMVAHSPR